MSSSGTGTLSSPLGIRRNDQKGSYPPSTAASSREPGQNQSIALLTPPLQLLCWEVSGAGDDGYSGSSMEAGGGSCGGEKASTIQRPQSSLESLTGETHSVVDPCNGLTIFGGNSTSQANCNADTTSIHSKDENGETEALVANLKALAKLNETPRQEACSARDDHVSTELMSAGIALANPIDLTGQASRSSLSTGVSGGRGQPNHEFGVRHFLNVYQPSLGLQPPHHHQQTRRACSQNYVGQPSWLPSPPHSLPPSRVDFYGYHDYDEENARLAHMCYQQQQQRLLRHRDPMMTDSHSFFDDSIGGHRAALIPSPTSVPIYKNMYAVPLTIHIAL